MVMMPLLALLAVGQEVKVDPVCTADARWAAASPVTVSRSAPLRSFTLFTTVSQPSACAAAEILLTAAYFDVSDRLICSGLVKDIAHQNTATQVTALEVRATNTLEFVRWRNGPEATSSHFKRLDCTNGDGTALVQPTELESAVTLRLYATVLARFGGVSTAELQVVLQP